MADTRALTLLVQLDALRHDYITPVDAPFLAHLARHGLAGRLQPTFGFEPDAAYLAGRYPDEADGGAHYWHDPEHTPFAWITMLAPLANLAPRRGIGQKILRRLLTLCAVTFSGDLRADVSSIPFELLDRFSPAPSPMESRRRPEFDTILSLCAAQGFPCLRHCSPGRDVSAHAGLSRLAGAVRPPTRFVVWHIGDLDRVGHRDGPESSARRSAMSTVDNAIARCVNQLTTRYDIVHVVVMGDHGMAEIRDSIDIETVLHDGGIRQRSGVVYFVDSTMVRFWFSNASVRQRVIDILSRVRGGRYLTEADLDRYHFRHPHRRFGDLIFLADPHVLISPNFFQGTAHVKGMHGYAPEYLDQQSAFIISSPLVKTPATLPDAVDMRRMFPTLLRLLGLSHPAALPSLV